jgi:hypothetical protein
MDEGKILQDAAALEVNKQIIKKNNKKIQNEKNTRKHILDLAKLQGCYNEAKQIMEKYDRLLTSCTDQKERKHIAIMGIAELHRLMNVQGPLIINGVEVLPAIGEIRDIIY